MLPGARLSFPDLWTAVAFKESAPAFSATFLIPKGSPLAKKVEKDAIAALNEKFHGKGEVIFKQISGNKNKCCIQDGDASEYDGYAGMLAIRAKSTKRPTIIDRDKSPLTEADGKVYAGCYVVGNIEFFGYDNTGKGLSATFRGLQFDRDGDSFGGGTVAQADEFEDLGAGADADDLS